MNVYVPVLNGAKNRWVFPVFLGDGLSLVGLAGDDYSNSVGAASHEIRQLVKKDTLSIRLSVTSDRPNVLKDIESVVFLLNARSGGVPVQCPIAVADDKAWSPAYLPYAYQVAPRINWKLDKLMNAGELAALASAVRSVYAHSPSAQVAVNRLLLSTYRTSDVDRIIDLAIAFESLVSSATEVSFKCALFNAFASRRTPEQRMSAFKDIKALYDLRSNLVHGALSADSKKVSDFAVKMDGLYKLCAKAIIAYVFFVQDLADPATKKLPSTNKIDQEWSLRQLELVMGVTNQ
jgi:hypothetical protein